TRGLDDKIIEIERGLNKKVLCEGCEEKKIEKLTDKCGNEEMARILYEHKVDPRRNLRYMEWIPFNEFGSIEYLAKGGFGEVHKTNWTEGYFDNEVVLKRIYNSGNKIVDILE